MTTLDTLKEFKRLRKAGFGKGQTRAVLAALLRTQRASDGVGAGLRELQLAHRGETAALRTELHDAGSAIRPLITAIAAELRDTTARLDTNLARLETVLRNELRDDAQRRTALFEALQADLLRRIFAMIAGATAIILLAVVGAVVLNRL